MTQRRIQRKRTKGWRMPDGAIYVGRGSKWGNPYRIGTCLIPDAQAAVHAFQANLPLSVDGLSALRGHDLACWCPLDQPCHADVLLEIANS
jgi:phosphopantothenate synthetase